MAPKRPILVSQWEMDHQKLIILLILAHFLLEAVEAILWDQNKIWRIKVKFPNLMSTQITSNQIWFTYFSLSGPNYKNHFALGHCVGAELIGCCFLPINSSSDSILLIVYDFSWIWFKLTKLSHIFSKHFFVNGWIWKLYNDLWLIKIILIWF